MLTVNNPFPRVSLEAVRARYEDIQQDVLAMQGDAESGPIACDWIPTFKECWKQAYSSIRGEERDFNENGPYGRIV